MRDVLIVVDMQNDFITGTLGTKEAQRIVPRVIEKVKKFQGEILCTLDTHDENYLTSQEGAHLPVAHCILGTEGHALCQELLELPAIAQAKKFEKPTFGSMELMEYLRQQPIASVELVGVCTDICVVSNALLIKAALPEIPVRVDASCCAGVSPEQHEAALTVMRSCQVLITGAAK
ncbi:cysteine hydrolase [Christensenellaceae bacterium OttesenSCG-928-L17]|nr:cysteine hydrolase [Christensenellaceae bacterium OttesenSCG-928-L17]